MEETRIIPMLPYMCNTEIILQDINNYIFKDSEFSNDLFELHNQISLRESSSWFNGVGSLFDYDKGIFLSSTKDYNVTSKKLEGSYLAKVISEVESLAEHEGVKIGRIRIMQLPPKTCYTLHVDPEEFRYHIPLITSYQCFFIISQDVFRMPQVGRLYKFKTNSEHTAVNASFKNRLHLVFDTYV